MHNWEAIVSARLGPLRLSDDARQDVIRELATHLGHLYDEAIERGETEPQAYAAAMQSVDDWAKLRRNIQSSREDEMKMTPFKRRVMLPGMVALVLSGLSIWLFHMLTIPGLWTWGRDSAPIALFIPWLICLPFIGGVGAWLARRNGASIVQRMLAAIFPVLPGIGVIILFVLVTARLIVHLAFGYPVDHATWSLVLTVVVVQLVSWVLIPALCALSGALLFLGPVQHLPPDLGHSAHA